MLSFLSQPVGVVAETDLATENMRWARFTVGFLVRLYSKTIYPCDLAVKVAMEDKALIKENYLKERASNDRASERRGYKALVDDDASVSSRTGDGLPPLRYGTVNEMLPEGWEQVSYDKMSNLYCGNVRHTVIPIRYCADFSRWRS
jgi:sphingosine kinase